MGSADQPDAGQRPAEKRRRWIPTAIIVPIVGVALSAWLLPAITRQWDDRQKERDLKAQIIGDTASATAQALVAADAIWSQRPDRRLSGPRLTRTQDAWARASLKIESRLRTYFADEEVAGWQLYTWVVDRFIAARRVSAAAALGDVVDRRARLDPRVADVAALLLVYGPHVLPPAPAFTGDSPAEDSQIAQLRSMLRRYVALHERTLRAEHGPRRRLLYSWRVLEKFVLRLQQAVDREIVTAHAAGYSTTFGDLVDDLVPYPPSETIRGGLGIATVAVSEPPRGCSRPRNPT